MLTMLGVQGHPAMRMLIGVAFAALGLARGVVPMAVVGGVLIVWGVASAVSRRR